MAKKRRKPSPRRRPVGSAGSRPSASTARSTCGPSARPGFRRSGGSSGSWAAAASAQSSGCSAEVSGRRPANAAPSDGELWSSSQPSTSPRRTRWCADLGVDPVGTDARDGRASRHDQRRNARRRRREAALEGRSDAGRIKARRTEAIHRRQPGPDRRPGRQRSGRTAAHPHVPRRSVARPTSGIDAHLSRWPTRPRTGPPSSAARRRSSCEVHPTGRDGHPQPVPSDRTHGELPRCKSPSRFTRHGWPGPRSSAGPGPPGRPGSPAARLGLGNGRPAGCASPTTRARHRGAVRPGRASPGPAPAGSGRRLGAAGGGAGRGRAEGRPAVARLGVEADPGPEGDPDQLRQEEGAALEDRGMDPAAGRGGVPVRPARSTSTR